MPLLFILFKIQIKSGLFNVILNNVLENGFGAPVVFWWTVTKTVLDRERSKVLTETRDKMFYYDVHFIPVRKQLFEQNSSSISCLKHPLGYFYFFLILIYSLSYKRYKIFSFLAEKLARNQRPESRRYLDRALVLSFIKSAECSAAAGVVKSYRRRQNSQTPGKSVRKHGVV